MKKALTIAIVLIGAVLTAGNWLFGQQAESIQHNVLQSAVLDGTLDKGVQQFDRGVFSTTVAGELSASSGELTVNWQQTTQHGPVPWQQLLQGESDLLARAGCVSLELLFAIETAFGDVRSDKPVNLTTSIGLMGDLAGVCNTRGCNRR